jgi:hypothetical protein
VPGGRNGIVVNYSQNGELKIKTKNLEDKKDNLENKAEMSEEIKEEIVEENQISVAKADEVSVKEDKVEENKE